MGVFGILYGSFWDVFWDVLGFYELLMGVSSNDGTFDPSTGPFWTVQTLNLRSFAIPSHLESLESLYLELQFQCSLSGYMYKYIYIYISTYNYSYRAYISLHGRVLNHGCIWMPFFPSSGCKSQVQWRLAPEVARSGTAFCRRSSSATRAGAGQLGGVMLPGAGVAFPMVQTCSNKVGVGRRFFLWNSGNFFGCFNIFNAFALKTLVL